MTLRNFLKLHQFEVSECCVSVYQEPYDYDNHRYIETYFEEDNQEDILDTNTFKAIAKKQVDHFDISGGGAYKVELCIYLKED